MCFVGPFLNILGSWEITVASIWWSFGARAHSGELLNVPMWTFYDFWWLLGAPLGAFFGYFFIFYVIWGVKKHVWITGMILDDFWLEKFIISDVPTSQTHTKNNWFSLDFTFFHFLLILMISGTCLDLILVTFGGLVAPFLWFAGLLYRYRNFNEFPLHLKITKMVSQDLQMYEVQTSTWNHQNH